MLGSLARKFGLAQRNSDLILASAIIFVLLLLIIPLTEFVLDALIASSILISILALLVTLYSEEALSFNAFPSFLLLLTLFRLGLNIATTRMILTEGHAGYIIKTFGDVVTGGNAFVGFVIFILLTGINFIVITKGSGRVAEVAARFTLDSLPGKQLAIDADVNAGLINEEEAKSRRDKIMLEADFYGAMDGASKFVRGDAIAGIVIILVNTFGGFVVGMMMKGMSWQQVVQVYVTLTVGDGLVTQIPALLVSVAAGIIVTRSSNKENLAESLRKQLFNDPKVLTITAGTLLMIGLVPGMPLLVIVPIAAILSLYAYFLRSSQTVAAESEVQKREAVRKLEDVEKMLFIEPMEIELGRDLAPFAEDDRAGNLLKRISLIRRQIATELGVVVPAIRISVNMFLPADAYQIKIKGNDVARGNLYMDSDLAMNPGHVQGDLEGIHTTEPAFGLPAIWIKSNQKNRARSEGFIVADPLTVLATHLTEVIRSYANELLNREEVTKLIDHAKMYAPTVVSELIPTKLSFGQILKVLQNLLRERVSIRDMISILEILADQSGNTHDPEILSEYVRQGLARSLSKQYMSDDQAIHAIMMDPKVEQVLLESIQYSEMGKMIMVNPTTSEKIIDEIKDLIQEAAKKRVQPVFLTAATLRPYFKKLVERHLPRLPVLSIYEIVPDVQINSLGIVTVDVLAQ
jgi:flagellar biosynthesis protein FlhA